MAQSQFEKKMLQILNYWYHSIRECLYGGVSLRTVLFEGFILTFSFTKDLYYYSFPAVILKQCKAKKQLLLIYTVKSFVCSQHLTKKHKETGKNCLRRFSVADVEDFKISLWVVLQCFSNTVIGRHTTYHS